MNSSLALLILLPQILAQFSFITKNNHRIFFISQIIVAFICLKLSIFLKISAKIYVIDFGFFQIKFMNDIYSYFFGILVCGVWILSILYSYSYLENSTKKYRKNKFYKNICGTIFCTLATGYSGNIETLFLFYILIIFYTAPLIISKLNKASYKAHRLYLKTHLLTSFLLFLPAIIIIKYLGISTDFIQHSGEIWSNIRGLSSFILTLFVFGIAKNCVLPFHQWITRSTVAPTPVSALLHSVAAVKTGSLALIKIVFYIFSLEFTKSLTDDFFYGGWLFYLCGITAIYAAYRAFKTTKIKNRFAYSTISQLSYILSSILVATKASLMGASLHIISHSLCKIVLFFIAGIFSNVYAIHNTKECAKIAPHLKFWIICLTFCGTSIIGLPLLPGSFGKEFMISSEIQAHHYSAVVFLLCGSFINILYIFPIFKAAFFHKKIIHQPKLIRVPLTMSMAVILGVLLAFMMSFYIDYLIQFFEIYEV